MPRGHADQEPNGDPSPLSWLNGRTPWWAKFTILVMFYFGFPAIMVGVLLGMGTGWIPSPVTLTHAAVKRIEEFEARSEKSDACIKNLLIAICDNTAGTIAQRDRCQRLSEGAIAVR